MSLAMASLGDSGQRSGTFVWPDWSECAAGTTPPPRTQVQRSETRQYQTIRKAVIMTHYSTIVLGGGTMGTAAALATWVAR